MNKLVIDCKTNKVEKINYTVDELRQLELERILAFEQYKNEKIEALSNQCRNSIMYGFVATNGHQYRLGLEDH